MSGCTTQKVVTGEDPVSAKSPMHIADSLDIPQTPREFRAVWVATVANIDWPSERGLPVQKQKQELIRILNRAASMNMNAIIFQVRPHADAMYDSPYEPWSAYLTGRMGQAPEPYYDPLEFTVNEAHKRGLELHAWFNPYRAKHPSDTSRVASNHISQTHPDLVHQFGDYQWMDPGREEVREISRNVIMDVVKRYDVDGVHLDDYFYPYPSYAGGKEFPDSLSWQQAAVKNPDLSRDDWRRSNVDRFIEEVYKAIKVEKPHVKFGISPFGTWRPGHPSGTDGFDAYSQLYADARLWLREGWIDYYTPQIYNRIDRPIRPFPVILQWWVEQNRYNRHIWPGLYTSRSAGNNGWPAEEITGQVYIARGHPGVTGSVHFSMRSLLPDWNIMVSDMTAGPYATSALVPASPWLGDEAPALPSASINLYANKMMVELKVPEEEIRWWTIWSKTESGWELDIISGSQHTLSFYGTEATVWPQMIAISAVDRYGNKSAPQVLTVSETTQSSAGEVPADKFPGADVSSSEAVISAPDIVKRREWGPIPGGYAANAVRKNISVDGAFRFRDLRVELKGMTPGINNAIVQSLNRMEHLFNFDRLSENQELELASYLILAENVQSFDANHAVTAEGLKSSPDTARVILHRNGVAEELSFAEGEAFNWSGYHIGVLAVNADKNALAGGLVELEVATVSSLPIARAAAQKIGGASQRLRVPHTINEITLHHTGSPKPLTVEKNPVERLQNLYQWGRESRNWWDIPYHYLIDLNGTIYEGRDARYAGDTNTRYDTRGHLLIAVMGNYDQQKPTREQIKTIAKLMAWLVVKYDLSLQDISAHFELANTRCPGKYLREVYEDGTLHKRVREYLRKRSDH